jgi:oligosaccharide repeat unit polymerase
VNRAKLPIIEIAVGVSAAALVIWLLPQPERYLQRAAAVGLLVVICALVCVNGLWGRERRLNIKDIILSSYALFLGAGMLCDTFRPDWSFSGGAILFTYASLLALLLGFAVQSHFGRAGATGLPTFALTDDQLYRVALLFFALGFGFLGLEWSLYGHLQSYVLAATNGPGAVAQPKPYVHAFTQLMGPGLMLALVLLRRGVPLVRAGVLVCFCGLAIAWYVFAGVRTNLAWLTIGFLLVWTEIPNRRGHVTIRVRAIVLTAIASAAVLAMTVLRSNWDLSRMRSEGASGVWRQVETGLDTFYQLRRTLDYFPSRSGYLMGYSLYGIIVNPIPRAIWNQKPIGSGRLASILYDRNPESTIGLSLPGELYANFGITGCLVGMFLFGVLADLIYRWYSRRRGDPCAIVVYTLLVEYVWFAVRGDVLDAASPVFYQLLPFVLWLGLLSELSKRARQTSGVTTGEVTRSPRSVCEHQPASLSATHSRARRRHELDERMQTGYRV